MISPGAVTVKVPVMVTAGSVSPALTGSLRLAPTTVTSPLCAPPSTIRPVGVSTSAGRSTASGFTAGVLVTW
ncbi:hypothetical protein DRB89_42560 [Streptomyces sp. ICC4]|nr:hypothetical protein DRB89_42560 [Streptomyces sp. ICC4]